MLRVQKADPAANPQLAGGDRVCAPDALGARAVKAIDRSADYRPPASFNGDGQCVGQCRLASGVRASTPTRTG
jgi:hypothetical protein